MSILHRWRIDGASQHAAINRFDARRWLTAQTEVPAGTNVVNNMGLHSTKLPANFRLSFRLNRVKLVHCFVDVIFQHAVYGIGG